MRSTLAFTAAATAVLFTVTGCATSAEPGPDGMTSDNSFTLYSGRAESLVQPLIDLFEDETGITVDVRYGDTPEMGALLLEEGDRTPAAVFLSQDGGALGALSAAGLFTTLPDDVTSVVADGFTSTDDTWVGVTGRARVIAYDSEKLSADAVPTTVDAFALPEWSGRLGIAPSNASFQAFVTAYRVLKGEEAADAWVAAVAANKPQIFENNNAVLAAVNDGVVETGLLNHYYWFRQAAETGAENMRAQLSYPEVGDPGAIVNVSGAGILATAATDADALEFVRFLVSTAAQEYFVAETFEYPLTTGMAAPAGLPAIESLVNPDLDLADLESLEITQQLLSKHGLI